MHQSARRTRLPAWLRGVLLFVCAFVTLGCWALASPPGSSPDDNYHQPSIWCAQGTSDLCQAGVDPTVRVLPYTVIAGSCYAPNSSASAACQDTFPDTLVADTPTTHGNWNHGYPPVFYSVLSPFAGDHLDTSVLSIRFFNALLTVGLLGAVALLVQRRQRPLVLVPLTIMSVPIVAFFLPSTNPSSWAILGAAALWPALYAAYDAVGYRRSLLLALSVVVTVVSAGARTDATLFSIFAIALVCLLRIRELVQRRHLPVVGASVLCVAIAVFLFFGAGQSSVVLGGFGTEPAGFDWDGRLFMNVKELPILLLGPFGYGSMGATGWLDTLFPTAVGALGIAVWASLIFAWSRDQSRRKGLAMALTGIAVVAYPLILQTRSGLIIGDGFQPRYVLPLMVIFTGICMVRGRQGVQPLTRTQLGFVVVALTVGHLLALHNQLRRYITGLDVLDVNLNADREWWWDVWFTPNTLWAVGSVTFAVTVYLVLRELRDPVPVDTLEPIVAAEKELEPSGEELTPGGSTDRAAASPSARP